VSAVFVIRVVPGDEHVQRDEVTTRADDLVSVRSVPDMHPVLGEIIGWELLLVLAIGALLFGSSQLPKLARSLGSAKNEFEKGLSASEAQAVPDANAASVVRHDDRP
jgi:sec-independent protein translocase protein TatA